MKRLFTALLVVLMVVALCSCGGGGPVTRPEILTVGDYEFVFNGYELTKDAYGTDVVLITYNFTNNSDEVCAFTDATYYEVLQNETGLYGTTIYVSEDSMETITKNEYEEIGPGDTIEVVVAYELEDTTSPVTINFEGFGDDASASHTIDITAAFVGGTPIANASDNQEEEKEDVAAAPQGELGDSEWYGWWMVTDATGDFEEYDGAYFDCCVNFEPTSEGYTLMSIWDEVYTDYNENCIGEIYLEYYDDLGYMSVGGYFLTGDDIASDGQVTVIPDITEIENTLFTTIPVEAENGGFTATLFLTEWGYEWDEELGEYPTYYDSYFLPLMEDGESLPANLDDIG